VNSEVFAKGETLDTDKSVSWRATASGLDPTGIPFVLFCGDNPRSFRGARMVVEIADVPQTYGIARWGDGYFGINNHGKVVAKPDPDGDVVIDLHQLAHDIQAAGLPWPILVRFAYILQHRVRHLCEAFRGIADWYSQYKRPFSRFPKYPQLVSQPANRLFETIST